ncbi:MAG: hypothetical protein M3220_01500 [Chloroflexota bacterium]|nr:hypothetical protein [Chloroflexota bacterium]
MNLPDIRKNTKSVTFTVTHIDRGNTLTYDPSANSDLDGDSDGTTVMVSRP